MDTLGFLFSIKACYSWLMRTVGPLLLVACSNNNTCNPPISPTFHCFLYIIYWFYSICTVIMEAIIKWMFLKDQVLVRHKYKFTNYFLTPEIWSGLLLVATTCGAEEVELGIKAPRITNLIIITQRDRKSKDRESETDSRIKMWLLVDKGGAQY